MILENENGDRVVINGGYPIKDCPTSWEAATAWEVSTNKEKGGPKWKFDCGFKLDYDGPVVSVSSRFYPPKTEYGPTWDGDVIVSVCGSQITKSFDCSTLEELKTEVEEYINAIEDKIIAALVGGLV